jgi:hypothetical protein
MMTSAAGAGYPAGSPQPSEEADHWVAVSAIWLGIPLVTHDAIFAKVKDLTLLTKLGP